MKLKIILCSILILGLCHEASADFTVGSYFDNELKRLYESELVLYDDTVDDGIPPNGLVLTAGTNITLTPGGGALTVDAGVSASSIGDLSDVTIVSVAANEVLWYDGAKWVNQSSITGINSLGVDDTITAGTFTDGTATLSSGSLTGVASLGINEASPYSVFEISGSGGVVSNNIILHNTTHEDASGGRESFVTWRGEQSGGEETMLVKIEGSHYGAADDQKGQFIFYANDTTDGENPTKQLLIRHDVMEFGSNAGMTYTESTATLTLANHIGTYTLTADDLLTCDTLAVVGGGTTLLGPTEFSGDVQFNNTVWGFSMDNLYSLTQSFLGWDMSTTTFKSNAGAGILELGMTTGNILSSGTMILDVTSTEALLVRQDSDANDVFTVDTTNRKIVVTSSTTGQSTITQGLVVNDGSGGAANDDLRVETTSEDNHLVVDASADLTRIGDFDTNYVEIDTTGDVLFVGGAGLAYASMYTNADIVVTLTDQSTWYEVDAAQAWTTGKVHNCTFTDPKMTVTNAGTYAITYTVSASVDVNSQEIEFGIMIDSTATDGPAHGLAGVQSEGRSHRIYATLNDEGHQSGTAIIQLAASKTISLGARNTTSASDDVTVGHANIIVVQIAGGSA